MQAKNLIKKKLRTTVDNRKIMLYYLIGQRKRIAFNSWRTKKKIGLKKDSSTQEAYLRCV